MKKSLMVIAALLVAFSILAGCSTRRNFVPGENTPSPSPTEATLAATETPSASPEPIPSETTDIIGIVSVASDKFEYKSEYIKTTIIVPRIEGLADGVVQDSINSIFSDISTSAQKDVGSAEKESKQYLDKGQTVGPYEINISYSVPYNHNGILSILLSDYRYLGGAHGNDMRSAYTFDLRTGRLLSLDDLMNKEGGYKDLINSSIRSEIDRRTKNNVLIENAPFNDIGNNPAFYLTTDAIVFYFQEYEYFPYAAGIQEFPIKYSTLSDMLKNEYDSLNIEPLVLQNDEDNKLIVGDIGQVTLTGNPTTGYTWHYTISDGDILEQSSEGYQSDAEGADGAGGVYAWNFRALKAGTATITFKYYRDWLSESDAAPEDNVQYTVTIT